MARAATREEYAEGSKGHTFDEKPQLSRGVLAYFFLTKRPWPDPGGGR